MGIDRFKINWFNQLKSTDLTKNLGFKYNDAWNPRVLVKTLDISWDEELPQGPGNDQIIVGQSKRF